MKRRVLVLSLLLVGLCLLGLGRAWNRLVPSSLYWGDVQAKEYVEAQLDLHEKSHHHGRDNRPNAEFVAAHERFEKISREFERAKNSRHHMGLLLTGAGILLLITGIGAHLTSRQTG